MKLNGALKIFIFLMVTSPGLAVVPDDHGNHPSSATAMSGTSNRLSGVINYRADQDYFSFPVLPDWSYVIQVATSTVWDVRVDVVPPAGAPRLDSTNTAHSLSPAYMTWTNPGTAGRWYLRVTGLFQFTTGAYQVAVWTAPAVQDADGDGMADLWELSTFGSLTNASSTSSILNADYTDVQVYLAGLEQTGGFDIETWSLSNSNTAIAWTPASHAGYDIYTSTNINGPWDWTGRRVAGASDPQISWTNNAGFASPQFYRIQFAP